MGKVASIIIGCFNRAAATQRCLTSIRQCTRWPDLEVICVDDGSSDGTAELLAEAARIGVVSQVISHTENEGIAATIADGWHAATGDYLAKIDNDIEFLCDDWLHRMISAVETFDNLGIVGLPVAPLYDRRRIVRQGEVIVRRVNRYNINGAAMLLRRETFERLGYPWMPPQPYGWFDAEYSFRSQYAGFWNGYLPEQPQLARVFSCNNTGDTESYVSWKLKSRRRNRRAYRRRRNAMRWDASQICLPYHRDSTEGDKRNSEETNPSQLPTAGTGPSQTANERNIQHPNCLEIGPGRKPLPGFDSLDMVRRTGSTHVARWGYERLPIDSKSYDLVYASHVLEHIFYLRVVPALNELYRILKGGGAVEIWVPDMDKIVDRYRNGTITDDGWFPNNPERDAWLSLNGRLIWGGRKREIEQPQHMHRSLFDESGLRNCLQKAGFTEIERLTKPRGPGHGWIDLGMRGIRP
jgi:glycosyltransferase involved in cell wall biosynthesis/predicted SAM-dependent methyltransferase